MDSFTFYSPSHVADDYGGVVEGWSTVFSARAHVRYLRGGETVQNARLQGRQPVVVTIRASSDAESVTPAWRMVDRAGTEFNIRAIVRTDDRMFYEITAETGVEV